MTLRDLCSIPCVFYVSILEASVEMILECQKAFSFLIKTVYAIVIKMQKLWIESKVQQNIILQ